MAVGNIIITFSCPLVILNPTASLDEERLNRSNPLSGIDVYHILKLQRGMCVVIETAVVK